MGHGKEGDVGLRWIKQSGLPDNPSVRWGKESEGQFSSRND